MKTCPFCAESVQDQAVKCRHCGSWLQEPPAGVPGGPAPDAPAVPPDDDALRIEQVVEVLARTAHEAATWLVGQHRAEVDALAAQHAAAVEPLQRALVAARQQAEAAEAQRLHGEAEWQVASDDWAAQYELAVAAIGERDAEIARLRAELEQLARRHEPGGEVDALHRALEEAALRQAQLERELGAAHDRARSLARRIAELETPLPDARPIVRPPSSPDRGPAPRVPAPPEPVLEPPPPEPAPERPSGSFDRAPARRLPEPASFDRSPARRLPEPEPPLEPAPGRPPEFGPPGGDDDRIPEEMSEALKSHPRIVLPPPSRKPPPPKRR